MSIINLNYSEYEDDERLWKISDTTFEDINLIVGKNSTGKSRLLTLINSLTQLLTGNLGPFDSGKYQTLLRINGRNFLYEIECKGSEVVGESLMVDEEVKLIRKPDGSGKIWYEQVGDYLDFKLPKSAVAAVNRRDEIQHPYLIELHEWAKSVALYHFGSDFGKSRLMNVSDMESIFNVKAPLNFDDPNNLVGIYSTAYLHYKEDFDIAIIRDMGKLGYSLKDIGSDNLQAILKIPFPTIGLFTVENDLGFKNSQVHMSQGMFRALALTIHLNICAFSKSRNLILVDDIGEGLDFERSVAMIDLLISKAKENNLQLIMTTNDRFVMNSVPLEYWGVLKRKAGLVKMLNARNSANLFKKFKYLGLNNFDLFASDYFETEVSE